MAFSLSPINVNFAYILYIYTTLDMYWQNEIVLTIIVKNKRGQITIV